MEMPKFKFGLGTKVRCKITGFTGVVIAQHRWLYGCLTYTVKPIEMKDGKPQDGFERCSHDLEVAAEQALETAEHYAAHAGRTEA